MDNYEKLEEMCTCPESALFENFLVDDDEGMICGKSCKLCGTFYSDEELKNKGDE